MADTRFEITCHAVERYVERYAVGATYEQGRRDLERMLAEAAPLKTASINGQELWRCAEPPTLFVVKPDNGKIVCVTVLPQTSLEGRTLRRSGPVDENVDEVLAAYERVKPLIEKASTKAECNQSVAGWRGKVARACEQIKGEMTDLKAKREQLFHDVRSLLAFCETGDTSKLEGAYGNIRGTNTATREKQPKAKTIENKAREDSAHCGALERKLAKQLAHGERMSSERDIISRFLAVAIRGLMRNSRTALEKIEAANPRFLDPAFWDKDLTLKSNKL
jgi:cytochrome c556